MTDTPEADAAQIRQALAEARETRALHVGAGIRHAAGELFAQEFGRVPALIVADESTFAAAGRDVVESLRRQGIVCREPFVYSDPDLYAEYAYVDQLLEGVSDRGEFVPVAVGSGTINDLVKLVAHRLGRPYLAVATAASMDGYTAFGASITRDGLKQTFECPAPAVVLADLDVIAAAPEGLNASGYADLAAKITAGADWLVAEALGIEPIDEPAWNTVQARLQTWLDDPSGVRAGDRESTRRLTIGLMMGGFAMQRTRTSRPASGAEHQFSHLWDMQHHTHRGRPPSHGFKVGIGTLASVALYEELLTLPFGELDVDDCCRRWGDRTTAEAESRRAFDTPELTECAIRETAAKHATESELRDQLTRLRRAWPELRERLARQLVPFAVLKQKLRDAGCPTEPEEIGIGRDRLLASYRQACFIRRRFTVLDLARRTGTLENCLERLAAPGGAWDDVAAKTLAQSD
ncbi:MAG: sn-glycerol-1-phosphate dehydrogenase [Planctomycetaceae bacterium]